LFVFDVQKRSLGASQGKSKRVAVEGFWVLVGVLWVFYCGWIFMGVCILPVSSWALSSLALISHEGVFGRIRLL